MALGHQLQEETDKEIATAQKLISDLFQNSKVSVHKDLAMGTGGEGNGIVENFVFSSSLHAFTFIIHEEWLFLP